MGFLLEAILVLEFGLYARRYAFAAFSSQYGDFNVFPWSLRIHDGLENGFIFFSLFEIYL